MTRGGALALAILTVGACGGAAPAGDGVTTAPTAAAPASSSSTTAAPVSADPVVLGMQSGRGDDGSFEIDVWFAGLPVESGTTIVVGIDSDDSYPGSGDVIPHLDGSLSVSYRPDAIDQRVTVDGVVVASSEEGTVSQWVSWSLAAGHLRVYFIGDVAPLAGTVWVVADPGEVGGSGVVTLDGRRVVAGAEVGYGCSVRGSATPIADVPDEVPDPGIACIYP